jgi:hypothetical protein
VAGVRDALSCLDIRRVRLADAESRTYSGFRDSCECGLNLCHIDITSKPSLKIRGFPVLHGLFVLPLRARPFFKRLLTLSCLTSYVEVFDSRGCGTLRTILFSSLNLSPAITTDSVDFRIPDRRRGGRPFATLRCCCVSRVGITSLAFVVEMETHSVRATYSAHRATRFPQIEAVSLSLVHIWDMRRQLPLVVSKKSARRNGSLATQSSNHISI